MKKREWYVQSEGKYPFELWWRKKYFLPEHEWYRKTNVTGIFSKVIFFEVSKVIDVSFFHTAIYFFFSLHRVAGKKIIQMFKKQNLEVRLLSRNLSFSLNDHFRIAANPIEKDA